MLPTKQKKRCFGEPICRALNTLRLRFLEFGEIFYVLFSGGYLFVHTTQCSSIHSISGTGRKPVKKIPAYVRLLLAMKTEIEYPNGRSCISYNRKGHSTFAVFILSIFIGIRRRAFSDVGCRSPPFPSALVKQQSS